MSTRVNSVLSTGLAKVEKEVVKEVVNDVDKYEENDFLFIHPYIYIFIFLSICYFIY